MPRLRGGNNFAITSVIAAQFTTLLRELIESNKGTPALWKIETEGIRDDAYEWYVYDPTQDWWLRLESTRLQIPNLADREKAITILDHERRRDDNLSISACAEVWEGYDGVWVEASLHVDSENLGWWRCEECERKFYGLRPDFASDLLPLFLCPECEGKLVLEAWETNDV